MIYKANIKHPMFEILQQLVRKHIGIDRIIEQVFVRLGSVSKVYLIGDDAKGLDTGVIEVVVEGKELNQKYLKSLVPKIAKELNKTIIIQTTSDFKGDGLLVFEK